MVPLLEKGSLLFEKNLNAVPSEQGDLDGVVVEAELNGNNGLRLDSKFLDLFHLARLLATIK